MKKNEKVHGKCFLLLEKTAKIYVNYPPFSCSIMATRKCWRIFWKNSAPSELGMGQEF